MGDSLFNFKIRQTLSYFAVLSAYSTRTSYFIEYAYEYGYHGDGIAMFEVVAGWRGKVMLNRPQAIYSETL